MNWIKKQQRSLCEKCCYSQCYCALQRWGEKKRRKKNKRIQKKIQVSGVWDFTVFWKYIIKSKIRKIFVNKKILEEYCVKIYEIDPYFYENYKEKIRVNKNGHKFILFKTDVFLNTI